MAIGDYFQCCRTVQRKHPRRKLSKFPEELILQILRAVHDTPIPTSRCRDGKEWTRFDQGTRDIQNVRLTCRLFNRISSELLIKFVGVDLSVESLARLQVIMHHPTIGKGVVMIRLRLSAYDWFMCPSPEVYVNKMMSHSRRYMHHMDREVAYLADWYLQAWPIGVRSVVRKLRAAAEPAYWEYRRRCSVQRDISTQWFIKGVADALAMSRKPLRLQITDRNDFLCSYIKSVSRATKDNLRAVILRPQASTWLEIEARCPHVSRDYAFMIPLMLAGFAESRVRIADLHFDITKTPVPNQVMSPVLGQVTPVEVNSGTMKLAVQDLRSFTYDNDFDTHGRPEWRSVLYNCLPPASLRDLVLRRVKLEPMSKCGNLTRIILTEVEFDVKTLAALLEPLKPHTVDISLNECFFDDNNDESSWADVLDLLRSKQRLTRLDSPLGWSIDDILSPENYNYLFVHLKDWHGGASKAEQYIRGSLDANPVRQHLNHD